MPPALRGRLVASMCLLAAAPCGGARRSAADEAADAELFGAFHPLKAWTAAAGMLGYRQSVAPPPPAAASSPYRPAVAREVALGAVPQMPERSDIPSSFDEHPGNIKIAAKLSMPRPPYVRGDTADPAAYKVLQPGNVKISPTRGGSPTPAMVYPYRGGDTATPAASKVLQPGNVFIGEQKSKSATPYRGGDTADPAAYKDLHPGIVKIGPTRSKSSSPSIHDSYRGGDTADPAAYKVLQAGNVKIDAKMKSPGGAYMYGGGDTADPAAYKVLQPGNVYIGRTSAPVEPDMRIPGDTADPAAYKEMQPGNVKIGAKVRSRSPDTFMYGGGDTADPKGMKSNQVGNQKIA